MTTSLDSGHPHLRLAQDGPTLYVTLDNPSRRNSQTPSLWAALAAVATGLPDGVRFVVLQGAGPSFSAGLDRGMFTPDGIDGEPNVLALAAHDEADAADAIATMQQGFSAWRSCPALVIAAVQGHAVGAGFQLALAADLRLVADDVSFVMAETKLGLVPDLAGTWPLTRLVGPARAMEICATARAVGAQEAVAIGLASVAVPAQELPAATADLIDTLAAMPPAALAELVPLLRGATERTYEEQLRAERTAQSRLMGALARSMG